MKIIQEKPINLVLVNSEIAKIKKRDKEVNYRVGKLEEYLHHFLWLKPSEEKQLRDELIKLEIPRLKELHIHKLIDIMPITADEVKMVLEAYPITITKTNCEAIAKTIKKFKH